MKVPFEKVNRERLYRRLDNVFDSNFLTEGKSVADFEEAFEEFQGLRALSFNGWAASMDALLNYVDIKGYEVVVPSNTFMATPLSVIKNGGSVVFADCNRYDMCLSAESLVKSITEKTKAVIVVHIGGHIAFDIEEIVEICDKNGIFLIEDCAHAHGASFKGVSPGGFGLGGAYSFYATKTIPLGEGGMLVTKNEEVIDFSRKWRNYGKPNYDVHGSNGRMNEITASFGVIQMERAEKILKFKRELAAKYASVFKKSVILPDGMVSGYYKYIVFEQKSSQETGFVYDIPCHKIMDIDVDLPNTDWVSKNHVCPPIWYGWEHHTKSIEELKNLLLVD